MACARSPSIAACLAAMYLHGNPLLEVQTCAQETDNDKEKKDYTSWRQFNEKPSVASSCPVSCAHALM